MNEREAHQEALKLFELDDVFVIESRSIAKRDIAPSLQVPQLQYQHRLAPKDDLIVQERTTTDGEQSKFVRYFVEGGVRVIDPDALKSGDNEPTDEDFLVQIYATLAVDYRAGREPDPNSKDDQEIIAAFVKNAVLHAWGVWRAHVLSTCAQMRVPPVIVPMMKPVAAAAPAAADAPSGSK